MRISIITVCYNASCTISDTLKSVAGQTYPHIEHVIIDGGSTDGTLDIIRREAGPNTIIVSESDEGIFDAMNKGWRRATGEVVAFLNADDAYAHSKVVQQVAEIMANPSVDACYADLLYVDRDHTDKVVRFWKGSLYQPGDCLKGWMPAHPTFFARRRLFEEYGGFNTQCPRQADFELAVRWFELHRIHTVYVPEIWTRMRTGGVSNYSITGILRGNYESYRACRALGFDVPPWFVAQKILSRLPQYLKALSCRKEECVRAGA